MQRLENDCQQTESSSFFCPDTHFNCTNIASAFKTRVQTKCRANPTKARYATVTLYSVAQLSVNNVPDRNADVARSSKSEQTDVAQDGVILIRPPENAEFGYYYEHFPQMRRMGETDAEKKAGKKLMSAITAQIEFTSAENRMKGIFLSATLMPENMYIIFQSDGRMRNARRV